MDLFPFQFISEFYATISVRNGEQYASHFEVVGHILQNIKDVIFITEEITNRCCKLEKSDIAIILKDSERGQHQLINNLTVSLNEVIPKIIIINRCSFLILMLCELFLFFPSLYVYLNQRYQSE